MSSKHTETQNYFDMYNNLGDQKTYIEKVKSFLVFFFFFVSVLVHAPCCVCAWSKKEKHIHRYKKYENIIALKL